MMMAEKQKPAHMGIETYKILNHKVVGILKTVLLGTYSHTQWCITAISSANAWYRKYSQVIDDISQGSMAR